ncbi:MAG: Gx transporter family protein, partial [Gammaproteobacteria bacterium]
MTNPSMPASNREDRLVAGFAALAIAIHILEASFPSPLPGVKPGLANVVTLVVFLRHGFAIAAWVSG